MHHRVLAGQGCSGAPGGAGGTDSADIVTESETDGCCGVDSDTIGNEDDYGGDGGGCGGSDKCSCCGDAISTASGNEDGTASWLLLWRWQP
jgi:hypothetical protein